MASLNKTPLFDYHFEVGAKMVPVGSWTMPFQFGDGYKEEYLHALEGTCITDIGCACILRMTGGAFEKMRQITPELQIGEGDYFRWQTNGEYVDSVLALRMDEEDILSAFSPSAANLCRKYFGEDDVQDLSGVFGCMAVWGRECLETLAGLGVDTENWTLGTSRKTEIASVRCIALYVNIFADVNGVVLFCDREKFDDVWIALFNTPDVWAAGFGAWDLARVQAGFLPCNTLNKKLPLCLGKWNGRAAVRAGEMITWTAKNVPQQAQVIYSMQLPHAEGAILLFSGEFDPDSVLKRASEEETSGEMITFFA
ncbi:MAG: aminomethyltransferase family protein [Lentisphaeria bacterium]|nr:aminomethyltransferase family protein [Lentisphaeria bacterium]